MILGIDLGTTYSVGAYIDENGNPATIINSESDTITPSVVYFENEDSVIVGKTAKENSMISPKNVVSLVKNYMGAVTSDGHAVTFETDYGTYKPEVISSLILKKIASDATRFLGLDEPITNVIVTKPAYFSQAQIKATEDAAKLAGLNCITLLNEPTAAALYYASKTNLSKANILVYDLGGGTFDATVIRLENGKVTVLSTEGLKMVGGSFFDAKLAEKICDYIEEKHGIDIYGDPMYAPVKQKLMIDIENAKIQLSTANKVQVVVFAPPVSERIELTRKDIDEVVEKLYERTENLVFRVIDAADLEVSQIDKVIMTGGSSKIPYIEERLTAALGMPVSREVNPNEVVALGAALYGKDLEAGSEEKEILTDVNSHGIGLKTMGKNGKIFNDVIIPKDTKLPAEFEKSYEIRNQKKLTLAVREGDDKDLDFTTELTTFNVDLPHGVSDGAEVRIKFQLDKRQLLHIFMSIPSVKLQQEVSFERKENMSDVEFGKWQKMIQNAADSIDVKNGFKRKREERKQRLDEKKEKVRVKEEDKIPKIIESVMEDTIGMDGLKLVMKDYMNRWDAIHKLEAKGQKDDNIKKCIVIAGKSGMGITHGARKIADILYKIGEVSEKIPVCAKVFDIVIENETKTQEAIQNLLQKAAKGVLIIDDFELFYQDDGNALSMKAIDFLEVAFREHPDNTATLVIAGNTEGIKKIFEKKYRFKRLFENFKIELSGYSADEYVKIMHARSKGKVIDTNAEPEIKRYLKGALLAPEFEYIYSIDRMVDTAITNLSNKLKNKRHVKDTDYLILHEEDFEIGTGDKSLDELMNELNSLTGIETVKAEVEQLSKEIAYDKQQEDRGEKVSEAPSRHMVFTGNPGTGKTTVARILAGIFRELGVLPVGHLVEAKPADLIAEHVGGTAPKTRAVVEKALGGVLFIDEAYGLWQTENDTFGAEAVTELLTGMENNRDNLIVIIAGYADKIAQLMKCNPGLPNRFNKYINFDDYNLDELMGVFNGLVEKNNMLIEEEALEMVRDTIQDNMREKTFGNARGVRNLYQSIISKQKGRLIDNNEDGLEARRLIKSEDVGSAKKHRKDISLLMKEINNMVGLQAVKTKLGEFVANVEMNTERAQMGLGEIDSGSMHMVFTGNPGTGKTTVARKIGEILRALNMLSNGELVEVQTDHITGKYEGEAEQKTREMIEDNLGKVVFIDEAYRLKESEYGKRAIHTLVSLIENHRDNLCVILAGYKDEMDSLLGVNLGLKNRFMNNIIEFEDYSKDELFLIFKNMMKTGINKDYVYGKDVEAAIKEKIDENYGNIDFGNARGIRNIVEAMRLKQSSRISTIPKEARTRETYITILAEDITGADSGKNSAKTGETYEELMAKLNALTGLRSVKEEIAAISDKVSIAQEYKKRGMDMGNEKPCMNMLFLGNPGTGKTTVARMVGEIYHSLGVLKSGHTLEVSRANLVAKYVGQTSPLVYEAAKKAMGGVLFIDEAYSLVQGENDGFGQEAVTALLKIAEDYRDDLVIILAGYESNMEPLYKVNPGIKGRFPNVIHFEDYTIEEKLEIFEQQIKGKYRMGAGVREALLDLMYRTGEADPEKYANGRGVRVIKEAVIKNQQRRIRPIMSSLSNEELVTLTVEDIFINQ